MLKFLLTVFILLYAVECQNIEVFGNTPIENKDKGRNL